jgi:hypothetical protein
MKEKRLIYQGDPCSMHLTNPEIQNLDDVRAHGPNLCRYYSDRVLCSPPRFGCVQAAGLKVARYVLEFYSEATEQTLLMEVEEFRRRALLPPDSAIAYIDTPEWGYRRITDPEIIVERVTDYARRVLDLKPGEVIFRSPEEPDYSSEGHGSEWAHGAISDRKTA